MYMLEGSVVVVFFSRAGSTFHEQLQIIDFYLFDFGFCFFGMVVVVVLLDNHSIKHETARTQHGVISLNKKLIREC